MVSDMAGQRWQYKVGGEELRIECFIEKAFSLRTYGDRIPHLIYLVEFI